MCSSEQWENVNVHRYRIDLFVVVVPRFPKVNYSLLMRLSRSELMEIDLEVFDREYFQVTRRKCSIQSVNEEDVLVVERLFVDIVECISPRRQWG